MPAQYWYKHFDLKHNAISKILTAEIEDI